MVISELVRKTASQLTENPRFEAEIMVMTALGISRTQLVTDNRREIMQYDIDIVAGRDVFWESRFNI